MVSSRMFEGYCADIESLLREGAVRTALRLALALPDICTALAEPARTSSGERYAEWCEKWLVWQAPRNLKTCDGGRLFRMHERRKASRTGPGKSSTARSLARLRKRRAARVAPAASRGRIWQAVGKLQTLEVALTDALLRGARRWYVDVGRVDQTVQRNLSLLALR